jgi:hypothetical protein
MADLKSMTVTVPIYGTIEVEVEASNRAEGIAKAMDDCFNIRLDCSEMEGADHAIVLPYEKIVEGNIVHVDSSEVTVVENED